MLAEREGVAHAVRLFHDFPMDHAVFAQCGAVSDLIERLSKDTNVESGDDREKLKCRR